MFKLAEAEWQSRPRIGQIYPMSHEIGTSSKIERMEHRKQAFGIRWAVALLLVPVLASAVEAGTPDSISSFGAATRNASPRRLEAVQAELETAQKQHAVRLAVVRQGFADLGLD